MDSDDEDDHSAQQKIDDDLSDEVWDLFDYVSKKDNTTLRNIRLMYFHRDRNMQDHFDGLKTILSRMVDDNVYMKTMPLDGGNYHLKMFSAYISKFTAGVSNKTAECFTILFDVEHDDSLFVFYA